MGSMYARSTTEVMYEQLVDGNGPDSSWGGVGGGTGKQELNLEWPYFRISLKLKVHDIRSFVRVPFDNRWNQHTYTSLMLLPFSLMLLIVWYGVFL